MPRTSDQLHADAMRIWRAGVAAVMPDRLIHEHLRVEGDWLLVGDDALDLRTVGRIAVVGAGKAGAGMAVAVANVLGPEILAAKSVVGWVNVPADWVHPLERIRLHGARPAGRNEPTREGQDGAREIMRIVSDLQPADLCLCLISGGGSALLPLPVEGISLADKVAITRHLSAAGADIGQLNTVRKQLSQIKGGGLARACRAGRLIALVISDVMGDPLDLIASGPTVASQSKPQEALDILNQFHAREAGISPRVFDYLEDRSRSLRPPTSPHCQVTNLVIGNNAAAVDAAGVEAERLGYSHAMRAATRLEGQVEPIGEHLATIALQMRDQPGPDCLISGGEGVVRLAVESVRGLGGRNQQLALAALMRLMAADPTGIVLLSAGTDGEDGPTDAAGALVDRAVIDEARRQNLDAADYLRRNDAYHFFEHAGGLFKTGPTNTNVCDLRIVLAARPCKLEDAKS